MNWIFLALLGAAVSHVFEGCVFPGGFSDSVKGVNPRAAHLITPRFSMMINGLCLLLCLVGAMNLVSSASVSALGCAVHGSANELPFAATTRHKKIERRACPCDGAVIGVGVKVLGESVKRQGFPWNRRKIHVSPKNVTGTL